MTDSSTPYERIVEAAFLAFVRKVEEIEGEPTNGLGVSEPGATYLRQSVSAALTAALPMIAEVAREKYAGHGKLFRTARANNYEHAGQQIAAAVLALNPENTR